MRSALAELFEGKCAFCACTLADGPTEVVHLRPPRDAIGLSGLSDAGHYASLAYDGRNLYASCAAWAQLRAASKHQQTLRAFVRTSSEQARAPALSLGAEGPVPADCGTTFSWVTRALGPWPGWLGGWAICTTGILVGRRRRGCYPASRSADRDCSFSTKPAVSAERLDPRPTAPSDETQQPSRRRRDPAGHSILLPSRLQSCHFTCVATQSHLRHRESELGALRAAAAREAGRLPRQAARR